MPEGLAAASMDGGRLSRISQRVILTHEDKTYPARLSRRRQSRGARPRATTTRRYHLVWTRDMVQSATALLALGQSATALRALVYLACTQHRTAASRRTSGSMAPLLARHPAR